MTRTVLNADSLPWLQKHCEVGAIITSLPDADEVFMTLADWRLWFTRAVRLCMQAASPDSCSIFYQTDRKHNGTLISKSHLVIRQASTAGVRLLWHKIVLRRDIGSVDLYRPGFTHMMAFSANMSAGASTADVFEAGKMIYRNAMGLNAAELAIRFACRKAEHLIVDPFCGRGSVLATANALGFNSLGIDIDDAQCREAGTCHVELQGDLIVSA